MISLDNLRSYKIFNMAVFDLIATIISAIVLQNYMWFHPVEPTKHRNVFQYIVLMFIIIITFIGLGIISHWLFGIQSALSAYIGINEMPIH